MYFLCNSCNVTSTYDEVNLATGQMGSGTVDIDALINAGTVGEYEFTCPKCKKTTLKHKDSHPSEPTNNTFSIVTDPSEGGGGNPDPPIPPEKVDPVQWNGYKYESHVFSSNRETQEQKGQFFWDTVADDGITDNYFGTKKMNAMEEGIRKANMNYRARQSLNMASAMLKLRTGKNVDIAFHGDSVMWG